MNINDCDLNEDFFHFTNRRNVESILEKGLIATCGTASQMINDRPNVSVSYTFRGVAGILNSFIYTFATKTSPATLPEEFREYFKEVTDYSSTEPLGYEAACLGVARKLKDEVYIRVDLTQEDVDAARIGGGFTGFDINLPYSIPPEKVDVVTDEEGTPISAYDFAKIIYEGTKDKEAIRYFHGDFFRMFEMCEGKDIFEDNNKEET